MGDAIDSPFDVFQHLVVPKADDAIALGFDEARADAVITRGDRMLAAVEFDYEPPGEAGDVDEIGTDRHLPPPFQGREALTQRAPQAFLGIG